MHRPEARIEESERSYDLVLIPNDSLRNANRMLPQLPYDFFDNTFEITVLPAAIVVGGILFGGLHCLARTFHFQTRGEALVWRVCSVMTGPRHCQFCRWVPGYNGTHEMRCRSDRQERDSPLVWLSSLDFWLPYVLTRLFLVFEMFWSLFFLPPETFVDTWSGLLNWY
jgi:hypothetical protein